MAELRREQFEIQRVVYRPTFNGVHNRRRALAFISLQYEASRNQRGLTKSLLATICGSTVHSIYDGVPCWVRQRYLTEEYKQASDTTYLWPTDKLSKWVGRWYSYFPLLRWSRTMSDAQLNYFLSIPRFKEEYNRQAAQWAREHPAPVQELPAVSDEDTGENTGEEALSEERRRRSHWPGAEIGRLITGNE